MARLVLSPEAELDMDEIWSYAADRHNLTRADALIDLIFEGIATLSTHPLIGKLRPELRPDVRSWLVGSHLIFYTIQSGSVCILRVLHGRQDVPSL